MIEIENQSSLEAALLRDTNLFVGAGFPILSKDARNNLLPIGSKLVEELCSKFNVNELINQQLPLVSQIIKSKNKAQFNEFLCERFRIKEYDHRYNCIGNLNVTRIFTTNIDNLFAKI